MTNGNLETRVAALEAQMQEIQDLLQQTAQLQNQLQLQLIQQASNTVPATV
jgi:cell shape-determining protein MreC